MLKPSKFFLLFIFVTVTLACPMHKGTSHAQNNARDLYNKGRELEEGKSGAVDLERAKKLYLAAARQKHGAALVRLAYLRETEASNSREYAALLPAYRWGAAHCNNIARIRLANILEKGLSGAPDLKMVKLLNLDLAQNGDKNSLKKLKALWPEVQPILKPIDNKRRKEARELMKKGFALENGTNGSRDLDAAIENYSAAAKLGHHPAVTALTILRENRAETKQDYSELIEDYSWAASQCNQKASFHLANILELDLAGSSDPARMIYLYRNAAIKGDKDAQRKLRRRGKEWPTFELLNTQFLAEEATLPSTEDQANSIANELSSEDTSEELFLKGLALDIATASSNDRSNAHKFYSQAASGGHVEAKVRLALLAEAGSPSAGQWQAIKNAYEKASTRGSNLALTRLANLYEKGLAGEINKESAVFYYGQAAARGSQQAMTALKRLGVSTPTAEKETIVSQDTDLPVFSLNDNTDTNAPTKAPVKTPVPITKKPAVSTTSTTDDGTVKLSENDIALLQKILISIKEVKKTPWWQEESAASLAAAYLLSASYDENAKAKLTELVQYDPKGGSCNMQGLWVALIAVSDLTDLIKPATQQIKNYKKECKATALQSLLTELGFYKGKVDGKAGPKTLGALNNFADDTETQLEAKVTTVNILALASALRKARHY